MFHPVTKESLGKGAEGTRRFFQIAVSIHRWLTWPAQRGEGQGQGSGREGMAQRSEGQDQGPQAQGAGRGEGGEGRPGGQGEGPGQGEGRNQPLTWRNVGGQITMASTLVFGFLLVSGLVLWIPRKFSKKAFKAVTLPQTRLKGRARDWNWHNLAGFWAAPLLLLVILTGTIMGYPWANRLMFKAVGEEPPVRQGPGGGEGGGGAREGAGQGEGRQQSEGGERRRFRSEGGEQAQGEGGERRERSPRPEGAQTAGGDNAGAEGGERRRPRGEGGEQAQSEGGERRERGPRPEGAQTAGGDNVGAEGGERRRPRGEGGEQAQGEGGERRRFRGGEGGEGAGMAMGGERRGGRGGQQETRPIVATGLNQALVAAKQDQPAWETITLDLPGDTTKPITATVTDAGRGRPDRRVKLTIDRETMAVTARENSFDKLTTGGKMRQFVRWLHTGEAGGPFGQFLAALGCLSAVVLVYTGFALAWRRLAGMIRNKRTKKAEPAA
ncbi:MAG: PepSY-associated TM helix domain-containing protein [Luteolibacter sp.]